MKTKTAHALAHLFLAALCCAFAQEARPAAAQTADGAGRYDKDGLTFDYPAGWALTDQSDAGAQRLTLTRAGTSAAVVVLVPREPISKFEQIQGARQVVTQPYVESFARQFGLAAPPDSNDALCQQVGGHTATGFKLGGPFKGEPHTAEVYAVVAGRRYVNVAYVRADKDEAQAAAAWKAVLDSLKVAEPAHAPPAADDLKEVVAAGLINGKAVHKPQPDYPRIALADRVQGTVTVRVTVDENGDVVTAQAVGGPPQLRDASERAAKKAKFTPTRVCGRGVRVSGVITYTFVLFG